jgi:tetratricopeptide (TPR) repeat protein
MRHAAIGFMTLVLVAAPARMLRADDAPSARLLAAGQLQESGDHLAAIELLEQIREIEPDNPQVLYGLAISNYAVGNYREAAHIGSTLLAEDGKAQSELHVIVGGAYSRLGDWTKSEEVFRLALTRWPENQTLSVQHAISMEALGRVDEAVAELEACLRRAPYDAALWRALGDALSVSGAPGRAFAAYVRSLTLEEDDGRAKAAAASLWTVLFKGAVGAPVSDSSEKAEAKGLALLAALRREATWSGQSDARFFAYALDTSLKLVSALHGRQSANVFWGPFVMDYFDEVRAAGLMETMAYEVRRASGDPDVDRWLRVNSDKVERFRTWSERWSVHWSKLDGQRAGGS